MGSKTLYSDSAGIVRSFSSDFLDDTWIKIKITSNRLVLNS